MTIDRTTPLEDLPELVSAAEAAAWLSVSEWLVFEACKRGALEHARLGRRILIRRSALAALAGREAPEHAGMMHWCVHSRTSMLSSPSICADASMRSWRFITSSRRGRPSRVQPATHSIARSRKARGCVRRQCMTAEICVEKDLAQSARGGAVIRQSNTAPSARRLPASLLLFNTVRTELLRTRSPAQVAGMEHHCRGLVGIRRSAVTLAILRWSLRPQRSLLGPRAREAEPAATAAPH